VLHWHLPYVRHPEYDEFLEENWLFEAIAGCYVPLLLMFEGLLGEGETFKVTVSISPPLAQMLDDPLLRERCTRYIEKRVELTEKEVWRTRNTPFHEAARFFSQHYRRVADAYCVRWRTDLLEALRQLRGAGAIELVTTAATHALLPLVKTPAARRAQVEMGRRYHEKTFGEPPRGLWLPECAYEPSLDPILKKAHLRYFFVDAHALLLGEPPAVHGVFAPVVTPAGLVAFARDVESSRQVWSGREGYPGDARYREFHRDIGYDAEYQYIRPYLPADGARTGVGLKYHRVTGDVPLDKKAPYEPGAAARRAAEHAGHFVESRRRQGRRVRAEIGRPPLIVSFYDAELFGHWWFEGPQFLEAVFRKVAQDRQLRYVTPEEYLQENPRQQLCQPSVSSWGDKGFFEVWVNGANDWIYRHLHQAEDSMVELAGRFPEARDVQRRALNQCARELMLAQGSDWPFLITTGAASSYASQRVRKHLSRFNHLKEQLAAGAIEQAGLSRIEGQDNIFEDMDYRLYNPFAEATS